MADHLGKIIYLGLLGGPRVRYSPSPAMHKAALKESALEGDYVAVQVSPESLAKTVQSLWDLGYEGLNVTNPHKITVMDLLVGLSDEAKAIGSINTLVRTKQGYFGENTDARGFQAAYLLDLKNPEKIKTLVLGAGGAARGVVTALKKAGFSLGISSRDFSQAEALAAEFGQRALDWQSLGDYGSFDLLVNATSSSSFEDFLPKPPTVSLKPGVRVIDINYGRDNNHFETICLRAGGTFQDGLGMLAHQARLSFILWTKTDPGLAPFLGALRKHLNPVE
ncbi:MAG: shikimate dehydrogenase [Deltaproteobacteria bacterium]|jgi:shikimate dehydrogenase|nr:shikimate dehydrogenase [Deltaproteobacteria bacterium]